MDEMAIFMRMYVMSESVGITSRSVPSSGEL